MINLQGVSNFRWHRKLKLAPTYFLLAANQKFQVPLSHGRMAKTASQTMAHFHFPCVADYNASFCNDPFSFCYENFLPAV